MSLAPSRPYSPLVYQVNVRQLLAQTAKHLDQPTATLDQIPFECLQRWKQWGIDTVWLCGIWQTGALGKEIATQEEGCRQLYNEVLPDWSPSDVIGSPYAVHTYEIAQAFGGRAAYDLLRQKFKQLNLTLLLDFVPNHTARDHPWVQEHPEFYIHGTPEQMRLHPEYFAQQGNSIFALGRDPYFPGWTDTFQLDYRTQATRHAMVDILLHLSQLSDGVRCDMAMLILSDIFQRTWGKASPEEPQGEFWVEAINAVRQKQPHFHFLAEAYWGLENRLHLLGFDTTYHKAFYDDLRTWNRLALHSHQTNSFHLHHSLFFLENHDEKRAKQAFPKKQQRHAAAFLTFTQPGMRLLHDGQIEGRTQRHAIQLKRRAQEPLDEQEKAFYELLLEALKTSFIGKGPWKRLDCLPTWEGASTEVNLFASLWTPEQPQTSLDPAHATLAVVNISSTESEARIPLHFCGLGGRVWLLDDLLSETSYQRAGNEMASPGLFVRLQPWHYHLFQLRQHPS